MFRAVTLTKQLRIVPELLSITRSYRIDYVVLRAVRLRTVKRGTVV
jgi:hypothetical protein